MIFSQVKKTDPLPKQLCPTCVEKITWCNEFDIQCIRAEETLFEILKQKHSFNNTKNDCQENSQENIDSCPLCIEGRMRIYEEDKETKKDVELYDSDIVLESSDEEQIPNEIKIDEEPENESITLFCLGTKQKYLKCGACMNLYHTKETLDEHKCKPNLQCTSKPYKCDICFATFTFEERLQFHQHFHKDAKALYCEICKITFGKELKLFYHYKRY